MAVALLVAAGSGERLGAGRPKAFVVVAGRPMIDWSLEALRAAGIDEIVVAAPLGHEVEGCVSVPGGATRSESVRAAHAAAPPGDVVVHDAARPLVTPEHFTAALAALADADCAVAAAPVTATVKEAGPDRLVVATLDRSRLWAIQTPQAIRRELRKRLTDAGLHEVISYSFTGPARTKLFPSLAEDTLAVRLAMPMSEDRSVRGPQSRAAGNSDRDR
jgi:2-C-methyl-D-erythritol 4-phosphate cytidylyltransferase